MTAPKPSIVVHAARDLRIIATDLLEHALNLAKTCGAGQWLNTKTNADALTPFHADKGQIDVHLECSGVAPALASGVACLRPTMCLCSLG